MNRRGRESELVHMILAGRGNRNTAPAEGVSGRRRHPGAVGIHTVTAFLYNGLAARPYWNSSILAPQFLASAFCSGPAILLIMIQVPRRFLRGLKFRTRPFGRSPS